nr:RNA-directed DNA polymerase, eukaryota [Tanacetum cinerariifolium]
MARVFLQNTTRRRHNYIVGGVFVSQAVTASSNGHGKRDVTTPETTPNMDHACTIARSIFVTNFPDSTSSKDLWKLCQSYGIVVDVYIPNRRSKAGKRFAFVQFIKVDNVDRLVGNLSVSDTYFGDNVVNVDNAEVQGFTPEVRQQGHYDNGNPNVDNVVDTNASPCKSVRSNTRIMKEAGNVDGNLYTDSRSCGFKLKEGGSVLDILDEMIKVGQTMGFSMVGCTKDMEGIIGAQGENVTKMADISSLEVKLLWGNYCFDHIFSEAPGSSGGILCVWDSNVFLKEQHIISDNFVALYGTWIPNKMKILLISVYAPQSLSVKRLLWNYLSSLITRWNGECLVMGDFNDVRRMEERWGLVFNARGADVFNSFISGSGLTECQLEARVD